MTTAFDQNRQRENAYNYIRRGVVTRSIPPGTAVNADDIARKTMADAILVKQAMDSLIRENWIEVASCGQARVTPVTVREVEEIIAVQRALDPLIMERAMPRLGRRQFAYLDALLAQHQRLVGTPDAEEQFLLLDKSFHLYLASLAQNTRLAAFVQSATDVYLRLGVDYVQARNRITPCLREHTAIVDALRRADCAAAKEAVRKHLDRMQDALTAYLSDA